MLTLSLPFPPSINHYFSYYQGRPVLSKEARAYRHLVRRMASAKGVKPLMGPLAVRIEVHPPDNRRRDADNVQKSVLDALQHAGVFWDDSQVVWLLSALDVNLLSRRKVGRFPATSRFLGINSNLTAFARDVRIVLAANLYFCLLHLRISNEQNLKSASGLCSSLSPIHCAAIHRKHVQ